MSDIYAGSGGAQLVARWDAEAQRFVLTGWTYGPAGPATVDLSPSIRLSVDYADPSRFSEITIDAPVDATGDRAMRSLLGPDVVDQVLALSGSRPRILGEFRVPDELARFALLVEVASDPDASVPKAARAAREALSLGYSVVDAELLRWLGELAELDEDDGYALSDAAAGAPMPAPAAAMESRAKEAAEEVLPIARRLAGKKVDIGLAIETQDAPTGSARLVRSTEIEVRDAQSADGRWARAFRRSDRLLLSLSPLRDVHRGARTLLVIPTGFAPSDLVVDVTDDPGAARPSDRLVLVRAAVTAAREACRLERLGYGGAERQWLESASAWDAAGSRERSDTARSYALGGKEQARRSRIISEPLDADYVD